MPIDSKPFRDAMALLGAAVNIITSDGPAGRGGFTASAVCSVTDSPPTLLVCMNRGSSQNQLFKTNGVLCVNTVGTLHQDLSKIFASGGPIDERFAGGSWTTLVTGSPVLEEAAVACDCRITEVIEKGTHSVLFAEVEGIRLGSGSDTLIYWQRKFHAIAHAG